VLKWQANVVPQAAWFQPPATLPIKKTNEAEIYQMFSALRSMAEIAIKK
jgi:hypothetical protein